MRHHVVQFPGDPGPLLRSGQRRLPVTLGRLLGSRLHLLQVGPAGAADETGQAGDGDLQQRDKEVIGLGVVGCRLPLDEAGQRHGAHHPAHPRRAAVHHRVESNHRGERQRREPDAQVVVEPAGNPDDQVGGDRPAPPPGQRQCLQHDQRERHVGQAQLPGLRDQRAGVVSGQRQREHEVLSARRERDGPSNKPLHQPIVRAGQMPRPSSAGLNWPPLPEAELRCPQGGK